MENIGKKQQKPWFVCFGMFFFNFSSEKSIKTHKATLFFKIATWKTSKIEKKDMAFRSIPWTHI